MSDPKPSEARMLQLENIKPNAELRGILPDGLITVVSVQWFGTDAMELTYKDAAGKVANRLLYRSDGSHSGDCARGQVLELCRGW